MSRLGTTIREARIKAKMPAKALGKKVGVSESVINDIESGRRIVSDDLASRMLKMLGVSNPVSTELEVAAEPKVVTRPAPAPYVQPINSAKEKASGAPSDAWLDALGGVVKRVPIMEMNGIVIEHKVLPVTGGKIEGGNPDKVLYYRMPDDSMRGFRIYAGDLLFTVPQTNAVDDSIMVLEYKGKRIVRKVRKQQSGKLMLQHYDREFADEVVSPNEITIIGRCLRLERTL